MTQVLSSRNKNSLSLVLSWTRTELFLLSTHWCRWVCPWCFLPLPDSRLMAPLRGSSGCLAVVVVVVVITTTIFRRAPVGPKGSGQTVEGGGEGAPHHPTPHSGALTALCSECAPHPPLSQPFSFPSHFRGHPPHVSLMWPLQRCTSSCIQPAVPGCTWLASAQPIYPLGRAWSGHSRGAH